MAPRVFEELGANVTAIGIEPDGININKDCGSTNPNFLREEVLKGDYDLGIAFDGDGDRILIVSKEGQILDGDDLLYVLSHQNPKDKSIVGTLMTNKALELELKNRGLGFFRAEVGDKFVLEKMIKEGSSLGGEPSGHIICLDAAPTGDAIIAALKFLEALQEYSFEVDSSIKDFHKMPQTLINLSVSNPNTVIVNDKFWSEVTKIERSLDQKGRVLIRPSGTEPLIRIMVESENKEQSEDYCNSLADLATRL